MAKENHREIIRRVIVSSLVVWLAIHAARTLDAPGVSDMLTGSLYVAGLAALPAIVLWPWLRGYLRHERRCPQSDAERRYQALISFEIVALCAMLILLLLIFV